MNLIWISNSSATNDSPKYASVLGIFSIYMENANADNADKSAVILFTSSTVRGKARLPVDFKIYHLLVLQL